MALPLPYFRTSACGDKLKEKVTLSVQSAAKLALSKYVAMAGRDSFSETFPYNATVLNDLLGRGAVQLVRLLNAVTDSQGKQVLPVGSIGFKLGQGSFLLEHDGTLRLDGLNPTTSPLCPSTGVRDMSFFTPGMYHCPISLQGDWGLGYTCSANDTLFDAQKLYGCGGRGSLTAVYKDDLSTAWKIELPAAATGAQTASIFSAPAVGSIEINNDVADDTHAWFPLLTEGTSLLASAYDLAHPFWATYRGLYSVERREYASNVSTMKRLMSPAGVPWGPYPHGYFISEASESVVPPDPGTPRSLPTVIPTSQIDMSASQVTRAIREPGKIEAIIEALRRRP